MRGVAAVALAAAAAWAQAPVESYRVENVPAPRGIAPEIGAIAFTQDGMLAAAFRRGYVYLMNPANGRWSRFAHGLQSPLGLWAGRPGELFAVHLPELTRIADSDGDGTADVYETVSDAWGMAGNYHEFTYGPVRDKEGNFYIALGSSSNGGEPRPPVRGELTLKGRTAKQETPGAVNRVGHYSPVPYRGCVLKIAPDGRTEPVSCGLRQPNGLVIDPEGELFVTDNQGDWVGTSPLHHVTKGAFHGHPGSLNWDSSFAGDPVEAQVAELARRRKMPAIQFPQNDMAGSVTQPLFDLTGGGFGPYTGQMLVGEWTYPRVLRVDLEKVGGEFQGASFILIDGNGLRTGGNRIAFAPDGKSLYVCQTSRIWGSGEGLQRIVYTGKAPMDILTMRLTTTGFDLTFTKPVDRAGAARVENYSFVHYYYRYHYQYGSPKTEVTPVKVTAAAVSADGLRVSLTLENLVPGRVYELRPSGLRSAGGEPLVTRLAAYTLNRLR